MDFYKMFSLKTLILTDSLSLPRVKPEIVEQKNTWPIILKSFNYFDISYLAIGGGTVDQLFDQGNNYYKAINPSILIIQSGIVDCAPRAYSRLEKDIIISNKYLSKLFFNILPVTAIRKIRNINYTDKKHFEYYVNAFIDSFNESKIFWIGIIPAQPKYEKKLPGISNIIKAYNEIIENNMIKTKNVFINTKEFPQNGTMSDFHHINEIGHSWIADKLIMMIQSKYEMKY